MSQNIANGKLMGFRPHELENICLTEHCTSPHFSVEVEMDY